MTPGLGHSSPDARERARHAADAASAAHDLERLMLSLAESLRRGETPHPMTFAFIQPVRDRLNALIDLALPETAP